MKTNGIEPLGAHFDREAADYNARAARGVWGAIKRREAHALARALNIRPGERVLDAGAGAGAHSRWIAQAGARVEALDHSPGMVEVLKEQGFSARLGNLEGPFPDALYDAALCAGVLEFTERPETALEHLFEALRPGGRLVLMAMHPGPIATGFRYRYARKRISFKTLSPDQVAHWARRHGAYVASAQRVLFNTVYRIEKPTVRPRKRPRLLACVAGTGLGGSSRIGAILDELSEEFEIQVGASGYAVPPLSQRFETHALESPIYEPDDALGAATWFRILTQLPLHLKRNVARYDEILTRWKPDLVLTDSDFYIFAAARKARTPLWALNHAAAVCDYYKDHSLPRPCRASYYFTERLDALSVNTLCERVLLPHFSPSGNTKKSTAISPIVRDLAAERDIEPIDTLVLLGGSGMGAALPFEKLPATAAVIGRLPRPQRDIRYLGVLDNPYPHLRAARRVVVQGGLNTLSELLHLKVPAVVVPIEGHAEQHANAMLFEQAGFGLAATPDSLPDVLARFDERRNALAENLRVRAPKCDGALQAAELIRERLAMV